MPIRCPASSSENARRLESGGGCQSASKSTTPSWTGSTSGDSSSDSRSRWLTSPADLALFNRMDFRDVVAALHGAVFERHTIDFAQRRVEIIPSREAEGEPAPIAF